MYVPLSCSQSSRVDGFGDTAELHGSLVRDGAGEGAAGEVERDERTTKLASSQSTGSALHPH